MDLGVYAIQFCQWVFQQVPKTIIATGTLNDEGVDDEVSAEINYGDNKVGKIKTSALNTLSNTAKIIGTKGQITVKSHKILIIKEIYKEKIIFIDTHVLVSTFDN